MADLPSWALDWLKADQSGDAGLMLATISHPAIETRRFVGDPTVTSLTSRGMQFLPAWFEVSLVNDDGKPARARFRFPNVSPEFGQTLERLVDPVEITLEVISAAHPDEPVRRYPRLQLRNITIDPGFINGELMGKDYSSEPLGTKRVTPANFQALFRRRS